MDDLVKSKPFYFGKKISNTNTWFFNFYSQRNIDITENSIIKEKHRGGKKLHMNGIGYSVFAKNILTLIRLLFLGVAYFKTI